MAFLNEYDDIRVVGESGSGREAIELAEQLHPDVAIIDLKMPGMDGYEAIWRITTSRPEQAIIAVGGDVQDERDIRSYFGSHIGFLFMGDPPEKLICAVRSQFIKA
jgi:DNA-binding NarL/FixJ family response regulator